MGLCTQKLRGAWQGADARADHTQRECHGNTRAGREQPDRAMEPRPHGVHRSQHPGRGHQPASVLPMRPQQAQGAGDAEDGETLSDTGEPLPHPAQALHHSLATPHAAVHLVALRHHAPHGMDHAAPHHLLQRPTVRSFVPRPHAPAGRTARHSAHRARLEDVRELPDQDIPSDRGTDHLHAGGGQHWRPLRPVPAGRIRLPGLCHTQHAGRDRQHTVPATLQGSAGDEGRNRAQDEPDLMASGGRHRT